MRENASRVRVLKVMRRQDVKAGSSWTKYVSLFVPFSLVL